MAKRPMALRWLVTLHLVGLGLHDVDDITLKGMKRVQAADTVFIETYTAFLAGTSHEALEEALGTEILPLDRVGVERGGNDLVERAKSEDVVLLVVGDPMAATTHADLILRAKDAGVPVDVTHAASIFSAAPGLVGLQHYKFGKTTTLVRPEDNWMPTSPFDALIENRELGLHTLVLLDIKADEGWCMPANQALEILLQLAEMTEQDWFTKDSQVGVIARAGSPEATVVTGTVSELLEHDFGAPLHCVVVPGSMQHMEEEFWRSLHP